MPIKIEQDAFTVKYMKRDENGNDVEVPIEEWEKASSDAFSRLNPYKPIKNYYGKPIKEMILDIAKHIENDEVSNEVLVSFFFFSRTSNFFFITIEQGSYQAGGLNNQTLMMEPCLSALFLALATVGQWMNLVMSLAQDQKSIGNIKEKINAYRDDRPRKIGFALCVGF